MRLWQKGALAAVAVTVVGFALIVVALFIGVAGSGSDTSSGAAAGPCVVDVAAGAASLSLDPEQLANAQAIVRAGKAMGVPQEGQVIALATALQESSLRNLRYGDRDSLGLFQQRPSQGWGTAAQLLDPAGAARLFYRGLEATAGWQSMPPTLAAQAVQRSAFPLAYDRWMAPARELVNRLGGDAASMGCGANVAMSVPSGTTGDMVRAALAEIGAPYVWGATGPDAFDCSGLVVWAWRQVGYRLDVRTAAQMYDVALPVDPGTEQAGDLVFSEFGENGPGPGHVQIVIQPGLAVEAPRTGLDVRVTTYNPSAHGVRIGRLTSSVLTAEPVTSQALR